MDQPMTVITAQQSFVLIPHKHQRPLHLFLRFSPSAPLSQQMRMEYYRRLLPSGLLIPFTLHLLQSQLPLQPTGLVLKHLLSVELDRPRLHVSIDSLSLNLVRSANLTGLRLLLE